MQVEMLLISGTYKLWLVYIGRYNWLLEWGE